MLEIESGKRDLPPCASQLCFEILRELGVECRVCAQAPLATTLASHAFMEGACILSPNRDLFYFTQAGTGKPLDTVVYGGFEMNEDGELRLSEHRMHKLLDLLPPQPKTVLTTEPPGYSRRFEHFRPDVYYAGAPVALRFSKRRNPNIVAAPLRAALYWKLFGPGTKVKEVIPFWERDAVKFTATINEAADDLCPLLEADTYEAALAHVFPNEESDPAHRSVVARIWAAYVTEERSLLRALE